jgi:hypothetical protein
LAKPKQLSKAYTPYPVDEQDPVTSSEAQLWPALKVQLGNVSTRQRTPRFNAVVDSGSPWCIFKSEYATLIGISDFKNGPSYPLGGVIGGEDSPREPMYFHRVNVFIEKGWSPVEMMAGFCEKLAVDGLLGRHGFLDNFIVRFDHSTNPPHFDIEKINRA